MNYYNYFFSVLFIAIFQTNFVNFDKGNVSIHIKAKTIKISLPFEISEEFYIQDEKNVPDNIIPTSVSFKKNKSYKISHIEFVSRNRKVIMLDKTSYQVLSGTFEIKISLNLEDKTKEKVKNLVGELNYQACNKKQCFYPRKLNFEVSF